MAKRQKLHEEFVKIMHSENVYFQPPETVKLTYPCIIYYLDGLDQTYADDKTFEIEKKYSVMYITRNADSEIPERICWHFPKCRHTRRYTADNLYHDTFTIYY